MFENIHISRRNNMDLNMYQCGKEDCSPGHSFGPAVRDHFLIHYIRSGKGFFKVGNKTYHLCEGQGFLICPEIITFYEADLNDPWKYSWVGFNGLKAENYLKQANLTEDNPIFSYDRDNFIRDCLEDMILTKELVKSREARLLGLLYLFLSQLIEVSSLDRSMVNCANQKEQYIKKAVEYIDMNFSRKISIEEISHYIGLNRSYLCSVFKEILNISPQEFLINFRISKACELMKNNALSIGDISRSVGYDDPLLFSKVFKKVRKVSPKDYRKSG